MAPIFLEHPMFYRAFMFGYLVLLFVGAMVLVFVFVHDVRGQEHVHGVNVPDWYDPSCCNQRDCRPLDSPDEIEPMRLGAEPAFKHLPSGLVFTRERFKPSQDERFHVCIYNGQPLCIYIPAMG